MKKDFITHLALVRHQIGQQHDVADVDAHAVRGHGVVDLVDDGGSGSLDADRLVDFDGAVGGCERAVDASRSHHFLQAFALHEQLVLRQLLLVD